MVLIHEVVDGLIVHERRALDVTGLLLLLAQGDERIEETLRLYRGVLDATRLDRPNARALPPHLPTVGPRPQVDP